MKGNTLTDGCSWWPRSLCADHKRIPQAVILRERDVQNEEDNSNTEDRPGTSKEPLICQKEMQGKQQTMVSHRLYPPGSGVSIVS